MRERPFERFVIETPDETVKTIFHTWLYHALLYLRVFSEYGGSYSAFDDQIHGGVNFTPYSIRDTYRAEHALLTLVRLVTGNKNRRGFAACRYAPAISAAMVRAAAQGAAASRMGRPTTRCAEPCAPRGAAPAETVSRAGRGRGSFFHRRDGGLNGRTVARRQTGPPARALARAPQRLREGRCCSSCGCPCAALHRENRRRCKTGWPGINHRKSLADVLGL